jgi:hypothetical protein
MIKFFSSKLILGASVAAMGSAMLFAPLQAAAGNTQSQGGGVKCYNVLVSYDAATGSSVYTRVCRKGGN